MSWFNNNRSRSALCFRIWVKTSRFDPSFFRNHLWRHCWATKRWFDDGWTWTPATGGISGLQVKWNSVSSSSVFVCDYWTIRSIASNRAVNSADVFSRVNGQYIMEGLASSFLFTMGGLGFIILDRSNAPNIPKLNRFLLLFIGGISVLLSFFMARVFMRMKLP